LRNKGFFTASVPTRTEVDERALVFTSSAHACDGCGQTLDRRRRGHVLLGPIVHTEIWRRLAKPTEALCWECMLERARVRLGRMLRLADLRPCRWNRFNEPYSYLDLLIDIEGALPTNLDAWRGVGVPGEFAELPQDLDAWWQRRRDPRRRRGPARGEILRRQWR
jgi:hypothetical protein